MKILNTIESIEKFTQNNKLTLLFFSSSDCNVCKALLPKIENMIKNYPKIQIGKIKIDKAPKISGKFSIFTIPCILFFVNNLEVIREARFISVYELEKKIDRYYNMIAK